MKRVSKFLVVFGLTFCGGIITVWILAIPTLPRPETQSSETVPEFVNTTVPLHVASTTAPAIDNQDSEETRTEYFTDDRQIGRRGKNKIEIRCYSRGDQRLTELKFYARTEYGAWLEMQSFKFEKDGLTDCDPVIEDFNNDGFKDFTYQSDVAARGANEIRKLFIYDKKLDELVFIENSEDYPNMVYNKKRDCIDAWLFYGATSTVFLKIEGNRLREFATVSTGLERVVELIDKDGNRRVISQKKMRENEIYTRYRDFDPVTPYS
jgi:hypothetical protein